MARTKPLTLAEHAALGAELHAINRRLTEIGVALANRYGSSSKTGRHALKLPDALSDIRSDLDSALAGDHPNEFSPRVYYPGGDPDQDAYWDHRAVR